MHPGDPDPEKSQGVTKETLEIYKPIAEKAIKEGIDKSGEQERRLKLIENALKNRNMEGLLLVILNEKPTCFHIDQLKKEIIMDNIVLNESEGNDYSGFYDWMRNRSGAIIGLRYTRLDGFEPTIITAFKKLPYLNFTHEKIIEIYFNPNRDYVDDISNDQDIGVCKMYVSTNQTYAILLDILYLTPDEFSSIKLN